MSTTARKTDKPVAKQTSKSPAKTAKPAAAKQTTDKQSAAAARKTAAKTPAKTAAPKVGRASDPTLSPLAHFATAIMHGAAGGTGRNPVSTAQIAAVQRFIGRKQIAKMLPKGTTMADVESYAMGADNANGRLAVKTFGRNLLAGGTADSERSRDDLSTDQRVAAGGKSPLTKLTGAKLAAVLVVIHGASGGTLKPATRKLAPKQNA